MSCIKCKKPAKIDLKHLGGPLCYSCFAEVIEKRVRKSLREQDWLKPGQKVVFIDNSTLKAAVAKYLLKSIFKGQPFDIDFKKASISYVEKAAKGYDRIIIPWSMDDETEQFLACLLDNKRLPKEKYVKLLVNLSDEEILLFAKIKKLEGKIKKKSKLGSMLDELEKRYPGSKFGFLRSMSR